MKNILIAIIVFLSSGCLKEKKIILKHDFEHSEDGWSESNLIKGKGYSGSSYSFADSLHPFSAGFSKKLSEITPHKVKRIDAVCRIKHKVVSASANLIVSLDDGNKNLFWQSIPTNDAAPELNEWARLFVSYDIPDSLGKNEILKVYIWNLKHIPVEVDDFEIRLFY